ncbi:MAG: hypothetical protein CL908_03720 [Deltaproteobacteria bacterium]|nr:hypothetical protein [Deltaproteobacteria bacterium]
MDYVEPDEARKRSGLRLVLTAGVPGPWGEAAKSIFQVKKIDYTPVRQTGGTTDDSLVAWTGHANAPLAVLDDEPARAGWAEILLLAERLSPSPSLIPRDARDRALMFGLSHEICGEDGFGWNRRHQLLAPMLTMPDADTNPALETGRVLGRRYAWSHEAVARANGRILAILQLFSDQLASQRQAGSDYLVGEALSAVDIYWATFAAMLRPLPHELCPMPDMMRTVYASLTREIEDALDAALIAHRDRIYDRHLQLPIDL